MFQKNKISKLTFLFFLLPLVLMACSSGGEGPLGFKCDEDQDCQEPLICCPGTATCLDSEDCAAVDPCFGVTCGEGQICNEGVCGPV